MKPWGKFDRASGEMLSLAEHSADVAATFLALAECDRISSGLERAAERALTDRELQWLGWIAALHDIGKCNLGFQLKRFSEAERNRFAAQAGLDPVKHGGHTQVVAHLLSHRKLNAAPALALLRRRLAHADERYRLLMASVSHHGAPIKLERNSYDKWLAGWAPFEPLDYCGLDALGELIDEARSWFDGLDGDPPRLPDRPQFVHLYAGLVSLADWIGSNRDPAFFPFNGHGDGDRFVWAMGRARDVVRRMGLNVQSARAAVRGRATAFGDMFKSNDGAPFTPTDLQAEMAEPSLGQLVLIEAETGAGKTEAALWRFKTLFEAGEVDSLAFLLPTRVAAVSLKERVQAAMTRLLEGAEYALPTVLAVPGYLEVDGERGSRREPSTGEKLPAFTVLWPDDAARQNAPRYWAAEAPKRYLAAPVAVGTIDQALLSAIRVDHAHLRGAALSRALLVVDEVHASDTYMTGLLRLLIERHVSLGGHVLLMSATLGSDAWAGFFPESAAREQGVPDARPYPAITGAGGMKAVAGAGREKTVQVRIQPWLDRPEEIAARALAAAAKDARVLIVRNTVDGAVAVQEALEASGRDDLLFRAGGVISPHHGRYAPADRRVLDAAVEDAFGKTAPRERGCVLVGTQTLEQSLDIDADLLITDLAPADVLLQRIGRLHRHPGRTRPGGSLSPVCVVNVPEGADLSAFLKGKKGRPRHGLGGGVYHNLLSCEATWRALVETPLISIPKDNRRLVEAATRAAGLRALAESLGQEWLEAFDKTVGRELANKGEAAHAAFDWSTEWEQLQWANHEERRLGTRLGDDPVIVQFETPVESPFANQLESLRIPSWMVERDGQKLDQSKIARPAESVRIREGELSFVWHCLHWVYGRWGLRGVC